MNESKKIWFSLEIKIGRYFLSIMPTDQSLFSRRNGIRGINFLGYNFLFNKIL